ncbi:MAG: hypothetical protein C0514_05330 [Candidatus Puniceispirillum sp.]|nr:hypothetical protein [Candidatus Puniceispirillum sp.]
MFILMHCEGEMKKLVITTAVTGVLLCVGGAWSSDAQPYATDPAIIALQRDYSAAQAEQRAATTRRARLTAEAKMSSIEGSIEQRKQVLAQQAHSAQPGQSSSSSAPTIAVPSPSVAPPPPAPPRPPLAPPLPGAQSHNASSSGGGSSSSAHNVPSAAPAPPPLDEATLGRQIEGLRPAPLGGQHEVAPPTHTVKFEDRELLHDGQPISFPAACANAHDLHSPGFISEELTALDGTMEYKSGKWWFRTYTHITHVGSTGGTIDLPISPHAGEIFTGRALEDVVIRSYTPAGKAVTAWVDLGPFGIDGNFQEGGYVKCLTMPGTAIQHGIAN